MSHRAVGIHCHDREESVCERPHRDGAAPAAQGLLPAGKRPWPCGAARGRERPPASAEVGKRQTSASAASLHVFLLPRPGQGGLCLHQALPNPGTCIAR